MNTSHSRRGTVLMTALATVLLLALGGPLTASAQINPNPDVLGVYFDLTGDTVEIDAPMPGPVTAYLILTNPSAAGDVTGWEANVQIDSPAVSPTRASTSSHRRTTSSPSGGAIPCRAAMRSSWPPTRSSSSTSTRCASTCNRASIRRSRDRRSTRRAWIRAT